MTITLLVIALAVAGDPDPKRAEYDRLADQMTSLAERNVWVGVERAWRELSALGLPVEIGHVMIAAQAARTTGDAMAVRERLMLAMTLDPNMETARWLGEMMRDYGAVILVAGKSRPPLTPIEAPFQPDRQVAIAYAAQTLSEQGRFEGLLPAGSYTFGERTFEVVAGTQPVEIALK